jgi:hypothetical protein
MINYLGRTKVDNIVLAIAATEFNLMKREFSRFAPACLPDKNRRCESGWRPTYVSNALEAIGSDRQPGIEQDRLLMLS